MKLTWESAGNDEPADQNADSGHTDADCASMYWSFGPDEDGRYGVELIGVTVHGDEQPSAGIHLGYFDTEETAKEAAQRYESTYTRPSHSDDSTGA